MFRDADGTLYFDAPEIVKLDGLELMVSGTEIIHAEAVGYVSDTVIDQWSGVQPEFEALYAQ